MLSRFTGGLKVGWALFPGVESQMRCVSPAREEANGAVRSRCLSNPRVLGLEVNVNRFGLPSGGIGGRSDRLNSDRPADRECERREQKPCSIPGPLETLGQHDGE